MSRRAVGAAVRWVKNRVAPGGLVLLYHRIADQPTDPSHLCVSPSHFAEHLALLHDTCRPLALDRLVRLARDRCLPARAVAVCFDDGYADNLYTARPLLERFSVPATVFVTTGYLGSEQGFWWDELEWLVVQSPRLPDRLDLAIGGTRVRWTPAEAREALRRRLYRALYPLPGDAKQAALMALRTWAGQEAPSQQRAQRPLTADEVVRLAEGGLVDIGAHSVSHPPLAAIPPAAQRDEIGRSRRDLERILGWPVLSFAYPHGSRTPATDRLVREAGYARAWTTRPDLVRPWADPFTLPRLQLRDDDGEAFARRLHDWLR